MTNYYGYNYRKYDNAELVKRNKRYAEKMRGFYEKLFNNHLTVDALQYMDAEDIEMIKEGYELFSEALDLVSDNATALSRLGNIERKVDLILDTLQRQE